jgi:hypothetical protein
MTIEDAELISTLEIDLCVAELKKVCFKVTLYLASKYFTNVQMENG